MALFVVRLSDLLPSFREGIESARTSTGWDVNRLQDAVNSAFGFLGAFTSARVDAASDQSGEEVLTLEYSPSEDRDFLAAERRFRRATSEAEAGRVRSALPVLSDLTADFPEVAKYHRALGQAHLVLGEFESAEDSMLRSLSLDPTDPDALTLLANLYAKRDRPTEAIPLYERSIAIQRNVYALNNLGAALAELGETDRALATLREAAEEDPTYPNTWFGIGLALSRLERLDVLPEAIAALDRCLQVIGQRQNSPEVWDAAKGLMDGLTKIEAREEVPAAQDAIRRTLSSLASDGEAEVRVEEQALRGVLAKLELAWVHRRLHHRLIVTPTRGPEREHHILHELQHLQLTLSARAAGANRWFGSTPSSREKALRSMASEVARIERTGLPHDAIIQMTTGSLDGLLGQLFNFPIDLLIETRLYATYPDLRELFYRSLKSQLEVAASIAHNAELRNATPKQIFRANTAMNGAFALWFEERYPKRTDVISLFQKTEAWPIARRLYTTWSADSLKWSAGAEYKWVDHWAEVLGMRGWYQWTEGNPADDVSPAMSPTSLNSAPSIRDVGREIGPSGPLDAERAQAAVYFMLGAMEWADQVSERDVGAVAASAAITGQTGIDFLDPESRYDLPGFATTPVSGLQLLSVMYALIKRMEPTIDQGIDLSGPYDAARELHEAKRRRDSK